MDITHLASFYEVVQRGSFSAAADALGVSKGMLSRHVSALESALNAQLLQRTTRRLSLTEAGRVLHQQAGEIFALAREAEEGIRALTEEDSGRLRFTCPVSTGDRWGRARPFCRALPQRPGRAQLHQCHDRHEPGGE